MLALHVNAVLACWHATAHGDDVHSRVGLLEKHESTAGRFNTTSRLPVEVALIQWRDYRFNPTIRSAEQILPFIRRLLDTTGGNGRYRGHIAETGRTLHLFKCHQTSPLDSITYDVIFYRSTLSIDRWLAQRARCSRFLNLKSAWRGDVEGR